MDGDTSLFTGGNGWGLEVVKLTNTEVQDVYISCENYVWRMFPRGLQQCDEHPSNYYFYVYSEYSQYYGQPKKVVSKEQVSCNGDALILKDLPVGTYTLPIGNYPNSLGKKASYTLSAWSEK